MREFTWRAIFHTNSTALWNAIGFIGALGGHGWTKYNYVEGKTRHALCSRCSRGFWMRRIVGLLIEKLCFALLIIAGGALALIGTITVLMFFSHPTMYEVTRLGSALFIAAIGTLLGIVGTKFARTLPVPSRIRSFIKAPFKFP